MDLNPFIETGAFYSAAGLVLLGAAGVALSRQVLHACLWLLPCLFGVGICFGLLGGPLLFAVQILVYVGAITVLIIFAVMLLQRSLGGGMLAGQQHLPAAVVGTGAIMGIITPAILYTERVPWGKLIAPETDPGISGHHVRMIGKLLLTQYLLPFEAISIVLLVAMVGAIVLARREKPDEEEAGEALAGGIPQSRDGAPAPRTDASGREGEGT
jgi:NADH:ubiquinone oxidoreductase subunit 6 (subunit J)